MGYEPVRCASWLWKLFVTVTTLICRSSLHYPSREIRRPVITVTLVGRMTDSFPIERQLTWLLQTIAWARRMVATIGVTTSIISHHHLGVAIMDHIVSRWLLRTELAGRPVVITPPTLTVFARPPPPPLFFSLSLSAAARLQNALRQSLLPTIITPRYSLKCVADYVFSKWVTGQVILNFLPPCWLLV